MAQMSAYKQQQKEVDKHAKAAAKRITLRTPP